MKSKEQTNRNKGIRDWGRGDPFRWEIRETPLQRGRLIWDLGWEECTWQRRSTSKCPEAGTSLATRLRCPEDGQGARGVGGEAGHVVGIICDLAALKLPEAGILSHVSWEGFVGLPAAGAKI